MNFHCTAYLYNNYPVVKRSMHFSPHTPTDRPHNSPPTTPRLRRLCCHAKPGDVR